MRHRIIAGLLLAASIAAGAGTGKTRNIILVTADGLRWQDLFSGMDPLLMNAKDAGMADRAEYRSRLGQGTPEERRKALLPFFWSELVSRGVVLGNVNKKSSVKVTNGFRVSYPGYSEILTGRAQDSSIRGNDKLQNPTTTVLEFLREKLNVPSQQVALFGSWDMFVSIGEHKPGSIFINAGYSAAKTTAGGPRMQELNRLQFQVLTPWESVRHDYITFEMALEYLRTVRPRAMHIALGETDDWAHDRRYDRVLDTIGYFDTCLKKLWNTVNSLEAYRGTTSIIVTVDHGRGSTLDDWHSHGTKVQGADQIWIAITGPDTPATGEVTDAPEFHQRDVAPTIVELMGIDYREYSGVLGKPIGYARKQ